MDIYMVQHTFARPDWEGEWNAWYANNLRVLLSVPGFLTGQRFKGCEGEPPRYMAMYTVESADVFDSKAYIDAGGGGVNSQRFRPAYQVWIRNLFASSQPAPAVASGECLVLVDAANKTGDVPRGIDMMWLETVGFHRTTPYRGIAVVPERDAQSLPPSVDTLVYRALTDQLGPLY